MSLVSVLCNQFYSCPKRCPTERCKGRQELIRTAFAASCSGQPACSYLYDSESIAVVSTTVAVRPYMDFLRGCEPVVAS